MYSKEKEKKRLKTIRRLKPENMSILDIGSGDCYISKCLLDRGAILSDCFDIIEFDSSETDRLNYYKYEITSWTKFYRENKHLMQKKYDIVLFLGIMHRLQERYRKKIFREFLNKTKRYFVFRARNDIFLDMIKEIPENFLRKDKFLWEKKY